MLCILLFWFYSPRNCHIYAWLYLVLFTTRLSIYAWYLVFHHTTVYITTRRLKWYYMHDIMIRNVFFKLCFRCKNRMITSCNTTYYFWQFIEISEIDRHSIKLNHVSHNFTCIFVARRTNCASFIFLTQHQYYGSMIIGRIYPII